MADLNQEGMDRREIRRRRRIRNQIITYITTGILLAAAAAGMILGARKALDMWNDKKQAAALKEQMEEMNAQQEEPVVVEAPEETIEPEQGEPKSQLDIIVDNSIAEMPLEDKVAGLFIITPEALTGVDAAIRAGDTTREKLRENAVGGLIYSKKNINSADQLKEMILSTQGLSKYPLLIAIEEEGGSISPVAEKRLAENAGDMRDIGASGDLAAAKEAGSQIAGYLSSFGFNLDLAPVADVIEEGDITLGKRSFGTNGGDAGAMAAAVAEGLKEGGVSACLKYFPGFGGAEGDVSAGMAVSEKTKEDFETSDFLSFQAGIDGGAEFVMVSHVSYPNITGDNTPSSLSGKMITELLRGELGFNGVIMTDAMDMGAITEYYMPDDAAVKALQAGADMILMPEDYEAAYNGVLEAVHNGTLSEERIDESLRRIYRVKKKDKAE